LEAVETANGVKCFINTGMNHGVIENDFPTSRIKRVGLWRNSDTQKPELLQNILAYLRLKAYFNSTSLKKNV